VSPAEWLAGTLRDLGYHEEHYGASFGVTVRVRKHLLWYATGFPGARKLRERLSEMGDLPAIRAELQRYAESLPPSSRRYNSASSQ
jgi:tRNA-dihydrouridine synthase